MNKTRWRITILAMMTVLLIGGVALAGPYGRFGRGGPGPAFGPGGPGGPGPAGFGGPCPYGGPGVGRRHTAWMMVLHRLDLTDEQKEAIKGIVQDSREQAEVAGKAVAEAHRALHEAVLGGAAEEDIQAAATAVGTAIGDLAVHKANTFATVKQALTAEQQAELEEILAKLKERAQEFRGKMQDPELREKLEQRRGRGRRGGAGRGWGGPMPHRRPGPRGWW